MIYDLLVYNGKLPIPPTHGKISPLKFYPPKSLVLYDVINSINSII